MGLPGRRGPGRPMTVLQLAPKRAARRPSATPMRGRNSLALAEVSDAISGPSEKARYETANGFSITFCYRLASGEFPQPGSGKGASESIHAVYEFVSGRKRPLPIGFASPPLTQEETGLVEQSCARGDVCLLGGMGQSVQNATGRCGKTAQFAVIAKSPPPSGLTS
jgi:hypothetical protein